MFRFEVTKVTKLTSANVLVLEGTLLEGRATTGMKVHVAGQDAHPFELKGCFYIVKHHILSLTVALHQVRELAIEPGSILES